MKLMIASDIHGSAAYCRALADAFNREAPDKLLLLGDIVAKMIIERRGLDMKALWRYHANLE